ncbi:hypothetical protein MTR_7g092160 [Medicago truncatula]|uniref:Uncharacterized protein n=1 Tax=Medicago truncatula TaxID=3880 RepID=G7KTK6_MEDTR|nr:hypothetical protein MTR_7g092160 [Medicago truncatula]
METKFEGLVGSITFQSLSCGKGKTDDAASNYIFKCVGVWSIYVPYILEHVTPKMETSKYCTPKLK